MVDAQLPEVGQSINLIGVSGGQVHVYHSDGEACNADAVTVSVNSQGEVAGVRDGAVVTLQYQQGGYQWRGRGIVDGVDGTRITLQWKGSASRGENRDFIRAVVEIPVFAGGLRGKDIDSALREQESNSVAPDSDAWVSREIDLSGNGVKFDWDGTVSKGDIVDFRLNLPFSTGNEMVPLLGRVVRVQSRGDTRSVALHFEGIEESIQDQLFEFVSARYHAQIQMALASATEGLDAS